MEKLVCAILMFSFLCNVSDGRTVQDPSYEERFDLKNLWGVPFEKEKKEAKQEKEEIVYGSCELMSADLWSTLSGSIEFKQKAESALEMYVNFSGLSATVPFYKLQVYTSGEIMDGCRNAGEPYITERYNGHLVDIATANEQGEVKITMQDVAATLLGDNSIFGRSVHVTSSFAKEPEACCVVVHGYMNNINIETDTDLSTADLDEIDPDNVKIKVKDFDRDTWADELKRTIAEKTNGQVEILNVENINEIVKSNGVPELVSFPDLQEDEKKSDENNTWTGGPEMSDAALSNVNDNDEEDKSNDKTTDESSWASYIESVYKEARANDIEPNSITKLVDITEFLKNQASDGKMADNMQSISLDINAAEQESLVQGNNDLVDMTPTERMELVGINNNYIENGNSAMDLSKSKSTDAENAESANWSNMIDKVYKEAKQKGIEPESITGIKVVGVSNSQFGSENKGIENIDSLLHENNKMGFSEGKISDLFSNEESNAADLPTINVIEENSLETTDEINDIAVIKNNIADNTFINEAFTEAKTQNIDENSIIKVIELPDSGSVVDNTGSDIESTVNTDTDEMSPKQERTTDETIASNIELQGDTVKSLDKSENLDLNNNDIIDIRTYEDRKSNYINTNDIENERSVQELSGFDFNKGSTTEESSKMMDQVYKKAKLIGIDPESIIKVVDVSKSKLGSKNYGRETTNDLQTGNSRVGFSAAQLRDSYLNVERGAGDISSVNDIDKNKVFERHGAANSDNNMLGNSFIDEVLKQAKEQNVDENLITEIVELPDSNTLVENMKTDIGNVFDMDSNEINSKQELIPDETSSVNIELALEAENQPDGDEISADNPQKDTSWQHIIDKVASDLDIKPESINKVVDISGPRRGFENDRLETDTYENGQFSKMSPTDDSRWDLQTNKAFGSDDLPTINQIKANVIQSANDQDDIDVSIDNDKEVNWPTMINEIVKQTDNKDITAESINRIVDIDKSLYDGESAEANSNFISELDSNIVNQENEKAANWPNLVNKVVKQVHNKDITAGSISGSIDLNKWNASSMGVVSNINQISPLPTKTLTRRYRFV